MILQYGFFHSILLFHIMLAHIDVHLGINENSFETTFSIGSRQMKNMNKLIVY